MNQQVLAELWRQPGRSTRAVIDLDAIAENLAAVKAAVGPNVGVMAVVKANAYGHGAIAVGSTAAAVGADYLGVATVDEGVQLRSAGIKTPILALGPVDESEIELAIGRAIELMVGNIGFAKSVAHAAEQVGATAPVAVHLKVDTGMRRFGLEPDHALTVARYIHEHPMLRLKGIASHFAQADEPDERPTAEQYEEFERVLESLSAEGIRPEIAHVANTAAIARSRSYDRDMVRLGIGLYGLDPSAGSIELPPLRPAMTIVSRVRRLFTLGPGDGVSYGATYRATSAERAALVPIGYADGYRRALSNQAWMSINGVACPVRGRVCMDQTVVGIPDGVEVDIGDTVIVAGASDLDSVASFDALASLAGTINYEMVAGVDRRVPRYFMKSGSVVGIEDLHGYRQIRTIFHSNA